MKGPGEVRSTVLDCSLGDDMMLNSYPDAEWCKFMGVCYLFAKSRQDLGVFFNSSSTYCQLL